MRSRKRSLADFIAGSLPAELQWPNRLTDYDAAQVWSRRRFEWCTEHRVDLLDLLRHDCDAKRGLK
jgi:hypothetical protein